MNQLVSITKDGKALSHHEAVGNAIELCGVVVYIPTDASLKEWTVEAATKSICKDTGQGLTMQQKIKKDEAEKNRSCISTRPLPVKIEFLKIVRQRLMENTPAAIPGENCHAFLTRRSQRDMSDKEMLETKKSARGKNKKSKKKKKKSSVFGEEDDSFEQYLESQKWNTDVEAAFTNLTKSLPKAQQKTMNRTLKSGNGWKRVRLQKNHVVLLSTVEQKHRTSLGVLDFAAGHAVASKKLSSPRTAASACVKHVKSGDSAMTLECTTWSNLTRRHPWIAETWTEPAGNGFDRGGQRLCNRSTI